MAARRDSPPPYEIMTRYPPGRPTYPPQPGEEPAPSTERPSPHWWSHLRDPIIFRLPRGYVILLGAALIGLMILAFWTGQNIGYRRGFHDSQAQADASLPPLGMSAAPAATSNIWPADSPPKKRCLKRSAPAGPAG